MRALRAILGSSYPQIHICKPDPSFIHFGTSIPSSCNFFLASLEPPLAAV